ncbi:MAG: spermidine synthase [Pseudomonadales bacterium]
MALVWEKIDASGHYQVRSAGKTVRLYKDGVFHSHYNPKLIVTRGVWDLLVLPALLHPPASIRTVLMLGVGGGAAIHLLQHFIQPQHITAIELDETHLKIATRFFNVNYNNTELLHGDAIQWVNKQAAKKRPPQFDLIIDDLYGEENGEPKRAIEANAEWVAQTGRLLSNNGLLVTNFVSRREMRDSYVNTARRNASGFKCSYRFENPNYENVIVASSRLVNTRREFKQGLLAHKHLRSNSYQASFSLRKIS